MNSQDQKVFCTVCGLEKQSRFCDNCKKETSNKYIRNASVSVMNAAGRIATVQWKSIHEFYEEKSLLKWLVIIISFASPFVGLFISGIYGLIAGLVLAILVYLIVPKAIIKIREINHG